MQNLTSELLPRIAAHRLHGLDAGPDAVYPNYDGLSILNIPAAVCAWLGIPGLGAPALADELTARLREAQPETFRHVVLLVVDGFGLNTLETAMERAAVEPDLSIWSEFDWLAPLTSIAPSTTAAALTTFWTGLPPAGHGVMAYDVWLKEFSMIANMIRHAPVGRAWEAGSLARSGFNIETFLPAPVLGPHLRKHGVQPAAFQHFAIARSGLSTMLMKEVDIHPYHSLSDLWVSLGALLDARAGEKTYTYIYWGDLDEHSHLFGPHDPRVDLELTSFSRQLGYFLRKRRERQSSPRGDTLFLVTADHGHIATPPQPRYELRNHPDLRDCLVMYPSGEARMPFVYLRPGREEQFLRYVEDAWPGEFTILPSALALEAGLFGAAPVYPRAAERVGDYVVVPRSAAYWYFGNTENFLRGRHGGLSRTEMLVPLLAVVL